MYLDLVELNVELCSCMAQPADHVIEKTATNNEVKNITTPGVDEQHAGLGEARLCAAPGNEFIGVKIERTAPGEQAAAVCTADPHDRKPAAQIVDSRVLSRERRL